MRSMIAQANALSMDAGPLFLIRGASTILPTCDGEGDGREAVVSDPVPQEAGIDDDDPMGDTVLFPGQDGASLQFDLTTVKRDELCHDGFSGLPLTDAIEEAANGRIETIGYIRLPPIDRDRQLKVLRQMHRRRPA